MKSKERKQEAYKRMIRIMLETSEDLEYLMAVYTFASTYPDKTNNTGGKAEHE